MGDAAARFEESAKAAGVEDIVRVRSMAEAVSERSWIGETGWCGFIVGPHAPVLTGIIVLKNEAMILKMKYMH